MRETAHARPSERGFTVVELTVVFAVISILAVMAIPRLIDARLHALELSAIETMRQIYHAQHIHREKYGVHARSISELVATGILPAPFVVGDAVQKKQGWEFVTVVPAAEGGSVESDEEANRPVQFRVAAQPAGATTRERLQVGSRQFVMRETGQVFYRTPEEFEIYGVAKHTEDAAFESDDFEKLETAS